MSITTYNTTYFDDLSIADLNQKTPLDKNYLRILFKPGYSVQVRELNQLQSILQNQIDRLGSSLYHDGTAIHGGNCSFEVNIKTVDVELDSEGYNESELANVTHIKDSLGLIASVYNYEIITVESTQTKIVRFYIKYNNSILDIEQNNISIFPTEIFGNGGISTSNSVFEYDPEENDTNLPIGNVVERGYAAGLFLSEGIFYVKGSFVHTTNQNTFFNYSQTETDIKNKVNGHACLTYREVVVNYSTDETLLDNANGTPNYSAPGADRYTIDLNLKFISETDFDNSSNSIRLLTIRNSLVIDSFKSKYTNLDQTFAQRTFEESGNYTVSPFNITVREFYNDLSNGGRYENIDIPANEYDSATTYTVGDLVTYNNQLFYRKNLGSANVADIPSSTSEFWDLIEAKDLYHVSLDRGVAYVSGYRIEPVDKQELYVPKARDASHISETANISSSSSVGQYVIGTFSNDSPLPVIQNSITTYSLMNSASPTPAQIGTCRIRAIEAATGNNKYALFLYDIKMSGTNKFSSTASIRNVSFNPDFVFTLDSTAIYDAKNSSAIFLLPYNSIQNVSDLEYYTLRTVDDFNNNEYVLTAADETFADSSNTIVRLSDGTITRVSPALSPDAKTIVFQSNVMSACLKIKIKSAGTTTRLKTKTKTIVDNIIKSPYATRKYKLPHTDVFKLISVVRTTDNIDVTKYCTISSDGQQPDRYTNAIVDYNGPALGVNADLIFKYEYLEHSSGDYFTVNSYNNLDYSDIASYDGVRLSDVYDFRPLILEGVSNPNIVAIDPNSVFEANINYYLPRKDSITINQVGEFSINRGEASLKPAEPQSPQDSMLLYKLDIPAYTFSTSDIKITTIDNRRYTMRDIGKLASRIDKLEYYTSLSLLEKNAMDRRLLEDDGTDRLKNGILVDSFYNHSIGNVQNDGYSCSVDIIDGGLSAKQQTESVQLTTFEENNVIKHRHSITLNYSEESLITQKFASETISVNPYDVAIFTGTLNLLPSTDDWKDTKRAPDIISNDTGAYDAMLLASKLNPNLFGTITGEWNTTWTGKPQTILGDTLDRTRPPGQWRSRQTITPIKEAREITQFSLGSTTTQKTLGENIIDTGYIPYIRSRKIYFTATGLKPNTRVYAFFDDIEVTNYCNKLNVLPATAYDDIDDSDVGLYTNILSSNNTFFKKQPLISDNSGKIYGEFIIPNNSILKFKTGERVFRLTSSPRNISTEAETIANANYVAAGTTVTVQKSISSIVSPSIITTKRTETRNGFTNGETTWFDPLAQTFLIPEIKEGVFTTSVDIFFSAKSTSMPVTLQIVTVENGIPTQNIVPFSKVVIDANKVNIDPNKGLVATNFRFSDPVYLSHGVEYAIILLSNDSTYRVWIASTGGKNVSDGTNINKNVYGGVFLTSQNASTWTPDQSRDLKFTLNIASFDSTGSVKHRSRVRGYVESIQLDEVGSGYTVAPAVIIAPPGQTATAVAVLNNSKVTSFTSLVGGSNYNSKPIVRIAPPPAGGVQAQAVAFINSAGVVYKISTAVADGGNPGSGYGSVPAVTIEAPGITATASASINPIDNSISSIDIETPGTNYRTAPQITIAAPTTPGGVSATAITTIEQITFSGFNLNQTVLIPDKTSITNSVTNAGKTYNNVQLNNDYKLSEEYNITRNSQISVTNILQTRSKYVSPIFHIERKSIICFRNIINNFDANEITSDSGIIERAIVSAGNFIAGKKYRILTIGSTPTNWVELGAPNASIGTLFTMNSIAQIGNGTAYLEHDINNIGARYITKQITLNNSSDTLNIYIDVNRPTVSTNVKLYVKFDDSNTWIEIAPEQTIPVSTNDSSYSEVQYKASDSDGEFTKFAIKILMLSDNPAFVPKIKDMRAIATI